jgi:hypothetical protein
VVLDDAVQKCQLSYQSASFINGMASVRRVLHVNTFMMMDLYRKQQQIAFVMSLLEDVRLQSPATHTGFVVAFSTATVSPVSNPHVKFRWFKMNSLVPDQFHQVDESSRAWYPPTADDIGCKICVQCEDKLGQGFSRYIEVGRRIGWGDKPF